MAPWTNGTADLAPVIRVHGGVVSPTARHCPTHLRTRTEHAFGAAAPGKHPYLARSALSPLTAVLDLVEHRGRSVEDACAHLPTRGGRAVRIMGEPVAPPHEGLLAWTRHAARTYLGALAAGSGERADGLDRVPVADPWILQYLPETGSGRARPYEVCVWGRRYLLRDGPRITRELRVPVPGPTRPPGPEEVAVTAFVVATGAHVDRAAFEARPWRYVGGAPYATRPRRLPEEAPARVRVVQVSCLDGSEATLFEGTVTEAEERYAAFGREPLRAVLASGGRVPGADCRPCRSRDRCGRLPRAPGLLGVRDRSRPRRTWSVTAGSYHRECPAKAHFHALGLPSGAGGDGPEGAAARRGHAVLSWIAGRHRRSPARACPADDLPPDGDAWSAGGVDVTGRAARTGASMLERHLAVCPLSDASRPGAVHVDYPLTVDDPLADVLVRCSAGLVFRRDGAWVIRELTTARTGTVADLDRLLHDQPRLALLVLLGTAVVPPTAPRPAIELEVLTPDGAHVRAVDPDLPRNRATARAVVRALAAPWHADTAHV
uniref:hypothetical protein n=1 Tax=Nocardiopsis lucentensis TaxID=53441 RepID=UPI0003615CA0